MVTLVKGKLSYYVLSCLSERDMYGLELIEQIKEKFGIEIKLPSLYSNLNRLKEQKFVSTYLKESNKGPKCSYSSITERGRSELEKLNLLWNDDEVVSPTLSTEGKAEEAIPDKIEETTQSKNEDEYNDYFNFSDEEDEKTTENIDTSLLQNQLEENEKEADAVNDEKDLYKEEIVEQPDTKETPEILNLSDNAQEVKEIKELKEEYFQETNKEIEKKDDYAQFTENKKLFDITQDFNKYRKRKSFTENQMIMNVKTAEKEDENKKQEDISSLKQTLQNSKDGNYELTDRFVEKEDVEQIKYSNSYEKFNQETKDDGIFITDRIPQENIPKARKIETTKLSFTIQNDFSKMPAPKRDASIDPSCADVKARLQQLYEKTNTKKDENISAIREYETYEELKDYYSSQDIDFKIYEKPQTKIKHNTNKLLLFTELSLFALTGIVSLLAYFIFNAVGGVNYDLSFLYYLFPIISFIMLVYKFYNFKFSASRIPKPMLKDVVVWVIFALGSIAIFCFSLVCGISLKSPVTYCTCIIYPIMILGIWLVARHFITMTLYKKLWK